jgi:large subunit ribosomal protein L19
LNIKENILNFAVLYFSKREKMNLVQLISESSKQKALEYRKEKDGANYAEIPNFKPGDSVNIAVRVVEGEKERIQNFKGIVIGIHGSGISKTFRVRKISNGVGVERIFPWYSPLLQSITVLRSGSVRRAKLYYLRGMSEKKIRQKLS